MLKSASVYSPYSGITETGANTPCLKHFFRCNEGAGNKLSCAKSGLVWDISSGGALTWNAGKGSVKTNMTANSTPVALQSGSWATLDGSKPWMMMVAGTVLGTTGCRFAIGDNDEQEVTPGYGWAMSDDTTGFGHPYHSTIVNSNSYPHYMQFGYVTVPDPNPPNSSLYLMQPGVDVVTYSIYRPGSGIEYKTLKISDDSTLFNAATNTGDTSLVTITGNLAPSPYLRFSGYDLYGAAIYQFNTLPSDILTGIYWNALAWKAKNRGSYPRWIGLT